MKAVSGFLVFLLAILAVIVGVSAAYTLSPTEQAIITQFGKPIGEPVTEAGLHFKTPFVQQVNKIEKRVLEWDGRPIEMPTKDKTYIIVDTFGRWQITDPKEYFESLKEERRAQSRLDGILGNATRSAIAKHELTEVIRTTKDRTPTIDPNLEGGSESLGTLYPITKGRAEIEKEIFENAKQELEGMGITLLDIRLKRINYNPDVRQQIYRRMISERQQIAERFRSEGAGEAAKILGRKERELLRIESEAYRKVEEVRGAADAKATQIYADAYNQSPEAIEFYEFTKSLEAYREILDDDTTLILSTDSDVFKFLKDIDPN
ncbi:MAG: protease modulator HflC [Verrucomicrobiota bacterium]